MNYPQNVWNQLKGKTKTDIIAALRKDGWAEDEGEGSSLVFLKGERRVTVHRHSGEGFHNPGLLKALLADIGWTVQDMKRLKLIK